MNIDLFGDSAQGCYRMRAPIFVMPRASIGDDCLSASPGPESPVHQAGADGHFDFEAPSFSQLAVPQEVGDELTGVGGILTQNYCLLVCLGDRIPAETGAAKVNSSRLETGPQWRDFLRLGLAGELYDGVPLDATLQCPCCLGMLRRPLGLPCGHSLCRGCFARLPALTSTGGVRRCPLCRADIPRGVCLCVNENLDAVCEALHAFRVKKKARLGGPRRRGTPVRP